MKKKWIMAVAVLLSGSLMFSSCIGSFGLTNKLFSWNRSVGEKWVNESCVLGILYPAGL